MSDPLFEHAVRDWLDDGSDRTPPTAIDAVLLAVKTTPQERDLRIPRRFTQMTFPMRLAAAIAIVAVVGVGALAYINRGPTPGDQPTATPTISATPAPTFPRLTEGLLAPGRYAYDTTGLRVILTVPAGWEGGGFHVSEAVEGEVPGGANLGFRQPDAVFGDPCREGSRQQVGPTVDDFANALADLPNVTESSQADVTISGLSGKHLSFTVDTEGIDCLVIQGTTTGEMAIYAQGGFVRTAENGMHHQLWILDVAGRRLVIDGATYPETSAEVRAELQTMVDTLVIEPD